MPNKKNNSGTSYRLFLLIQLALFGFMTYLWCLIQVNGYIDQPINFVFGLLLAFVPLSGFFAGMFVSSEWGFLKSRVGRSVMLISLGLLFWSLGTFIFAYYNIVGNIDVPYPSVADFAYVSLYVFYILGALSLFKTSGASAGVKSLGGKLLVVSIPLVVFVASYNVLMAGAFDLSEGISWVFLMDVFYPLGDVAMLSMILLVVLLSYRYLGGIYKSAIYVMFVGFVFEFFADFAFTVTTYNETFFVASWVDFLFLISTSLVSISLILFSPQRLNEVKHVNQ